MRLTSPFAAGRAHPARSLAAATTVLALGVATFGVVLGGQAGAAPGCRVDYSASNWGGGGGFTASVKITNLGDPVAGWTLRFTFPGNQRVTLPGWSANWAQAAGSAAVTATNLSWNGNLTAGQSTDIGFNGTFTGTNASPASFSLNNTVCTGAPPPTTTTTTTTTTGPPPPPPPGKVDNPYVGARVYVNPDWAAKATAEPGGSRIANQPTGVWMDRIAAIAGTPGARGLRSHLDEAVRQAAGQPLVFQLVIYNLPGRDCAALASNGELGPTDIARYRTQYIDPIAAILRDQAYRNLRIVTVIEIDSLPNLVTNVTPRPTSTPQCDVMKANGNYINGVGYALATLGAVANVYNYIDAGHHGWIGWDDNFGASADLMATAARASGSTPAMVHGFITNTANYGPTVEPYFTINDVIAGRPVREAARWIDYNRYVDEQSFAQAFRQRAVQAGFPAGIGMLIDTSRNGWGGTARPTGPGPNTSADAYVNGGRLDRRIHLGNWCNQSGAGLGARPTSAPAAGIDAYVWIKPPGESDGSSTEIPNNEGKGFDRMCDPTYTGNVRNGNSMSGSLPNAPLSGHWFSAQFQELMRNAFPPLT